MNLLIVESPNKCHHIKSFLSSNYTVEASLGHIRSIPEKGMNIDMKTFEPVFEVDKKKSAVVKKLKECASKADIVYLATDGDREGEAISWHLWSLLPAKDKKKCLRITFKEITKKALLDAIAHPRELDQNLILAQKARQVLDRLIGYGASPVLWSTIDRHGSAGRVQSPTLRMICDRQKEINVFKPEDYWFIDATLRCCKGPFMARVNTKEKDNKYLDHKVVEKDLPELRVATYKIASIERKEKSVTPYPPFDNSGLLMAGSAVLGWGAPKIMEVAQNLFETGRVTYHRTDSYAISSEAMDDVRAYIKDTYPDCLPDKPHFYSKKSSVASLEAHECVHPTNPADPCPDLSGDAKRLYDLIRARFTACQMKPMIVNTVKYTIQASSGHVLTASGQTIKEEGWYKAYPYSKVKDELLPIATEGEELILVTVEDSKHSTQPPPRFNDGSLVDHMEARSIGRPSTRAAIIKALHDKGYVDKDGKAFVPTELGNKICDFLEPRFIDFFMDYKFTAGIEEELDKLANGTALYMDVVSKVYSALKAKVSEVKASIPKKEKVLAGGKCVVCKTGDVLEKESRFGKFYCCSLYPKCKAILTKNDDGTFSEKKRAPKPETTGEKCPDCHKGELILRTNHAKGTHFYGCSAYPRCRYTRDAGDEK